MNWYEKLNEYFPIEEMKSQEHMEMLLKEKSDVYYKDEGPNHVLMYAEFETFIFIDYLYVSSKSRGQGLGHKIIEKLKTRKKPIILEVEPVDYEETDSEKRLHFYKREGFKHAQSIGYTRRSLATNEENPLEILYWAPDNADEEMIYKKMCKMYEDIHTYKDEEIYGKAYQSTEEVLSYDNDRTADDIFEVLTEKV